MLTTSGGNESFRAGARMQITSQFLFKHNDKLGLREEAFRSTGYCAWGWRTLILRALAGGMHLLLHKGRVPYCC